MKKKMTIEESFAKLDEMVRALESDEVEKKLRKVEEDGTTEDFE